MLKSASDPGATGTQRILPAGFPPSAVEVGEFAARLDLPFACDALDGPPDTQQLTAAAAANAGVLAALLQTIDLEAGPRPADERLVEALAPIRSKLDALAGMVARLLYRDVELPPHRDVELGSRRIAWSGGGVRQAAAWLRLRLYFDPVFREPITLFARIVEAGEGADGGRVEAALSEMPEHVLADLGRLALLVQRRQRAAAGAGIRKASE